MENDAATLYCPNELCQAANPLTHKFCQRCSTPLPKRYLWAVTDNSIVGNPGELLQERYLIIEHNVLFDTKPGFLPQIPEQQNLDAIKSYLRLIPYRLHVPQVYGMLYLNAGNTQSEILLLEKPPVILNQAPTKVQLCDELSAVWEASTSLRQLNWLWQIAQLWQPLASLGVASSLLTKNLIRAEGSIVRLLELKSDGEIQPNLSDVGQFWQQEFLSKAQPTIRDFIGEVCRLLIEKEIHSSEQLTAVLDKGLVSLSKFHEPTIKVFALTDTGPSRQRNEDASYPQSGIEITKPPSKSALTIVCDGIGGHEGGNVASNLAIETIQQYLAQLANLPEDHIDSTALLADLEKAAAAANDKISQRNDSENRQGRQRMGTTVVMGLPVAHEMYIAHVGDSRAYLITHNNCHQITLDDDVASREVRLGYAVYRDALQQPASGSLVQALGMNPSSALYPTSQRFILDEDCVFLLCSDGLSDFDRIEQHWDTEILPLLYHNSDVVSVTKQLLEIANNQNGHDNVTVSVIHCQIKYSEPKLALEVNLADISLISPAYSSHLATFTQNFTNQKTEVINEKSTRKGFGLPLTLGIFALLFMIGGGLGYLWKQGIFLGNNFDSLTPVVKKQETPTISPNSQSANSDRKDIDKGSLITTKEEINNLSEILPPADGPPPQPRSPIYAPSDSVLLVQKKETRKADDWLQVKVCSVGQEGLATNPSGTTSTPPRIKTITEPGNEFWVKSSQLKASEYENPDGLQNECPANKTSTVNGDTSSSTPVEDSQTPDQPIPSEPNPISSP